jgi:MFS family permease
VTFLALPLSAAILLHATPLQMGILTAMEALPYTLFGLFTGVLVDRSRKRPLIIAADLLRGGALLAVPLVAWLDALSMPILYLVGFLVGLGGIVGWAAYQVFMTERVGRENLVEANSHIALSDSSAQLIGPGLAGIFIQWLTAPFAILLDAGSFFISAWMLRGIPDQASDVPKLRNPAGAARFAGIWADAREGLQLIWHNPILRSLAWGLALWQFVKHIYLAIIILYAARELQLSAGRIGAIWMMGGAGFLLASFAIHRLNRRYGVGRVMLSGLIVTGVSWLMIAAVAPGAWAGPQLGLALFFFDLGAMLFFINYLSLRQSVTPDHLLGRVTSTMIFLSIAMAPAGSLVGGLMGTAFGLRSTIAISGVGGLLLSIALLRFSPLSAMRQLPTADSVAVNSQELAAE